MNRAKITIHLVAAALFIETSILFSKNYQNITVNGFDFMAILRQVFETSSTAMLCI
jgi:hypothetical protein